VRERHHRGTQGLGAVVEAETGREDPRLEGDLDHIVGSDAGGGQVPSHQSGEVAHIVGREADNAGAAGGAGRHVDPDDLTQRHGEHAIGIAGAEVVLARQRQAPQVVE